MNMMRINNKRGMASLIALIMVAMLTLLGLAALSTSDDEVSIAGNEKQETRAFYAAEAGLEKAAAALQSQFDTTGVPPSVMPSGSETVNNCLVAYNAVNNGPAAYKDLSNGTLAGLHALVQSFSMTSTASNASFNATVQLSQTFEAALVPIFQFAVFYDKDLEMAPGTDMTVLGRVHSNGNMWLQAGSNLKMNSYTTASGHIWHGRKGPGPVKVGDVLVKNGSGNYVSMKEGAGWLDANDAHWYDSSVARWQGRVQDSTHGQGPLNLPLSPTAAGNLHKVIERAGGNPDSYESKATLKFIDRQAYQKVGGVWVNVTANMISDGVITFTDDKFYDGRESDWVDCMELDIEELYDEGYAPSNGVIYFSDQTSDFPALRVNNGTKLDSGLTIASENPVYVNGDYNKTNKKPAALFGDAITFLSNSWDDVNSSASLNSRVASNTVVNACYLTGNTETTASNYNGGFENLPRFLEKWSGKTFTWKGSAINLWNSVQANGNWSYGSYYTAPNRNWAFDTDLDDPNNMPPETPVFRVFQRIGWHQQHVGYEPET
jgi:Tfp pilus assembly protein PilX